MKTTLENAHYTSILNRFLECPPSGKGGYKIFIQAMADDLLSGRTLAPRTAEEAERLIRITDAESIFFYGKENGESMAYIRRRR